MGEVGDRRSPTFVLPSSQDQGLGPGNPDAGGRLMPKFSTSPCVQTKTTWPPGTLSTVHRVSPSIREQKKTSKMPFLG